MIRNAGVQDLKHFVQSRLAEESLFPPTLQCVTRSCRNDLPERKESKFELQCLFTPTTVASKCCNRRNHCMFSENKRALLAPSIIKYSCIHFIATP